MPPPTVKVKNKDGTVSYQRQQSTALRDKMDMKRGGRDAPAGGYYDAEGKLRRQGYRPEAPQTDPGPPPDPKGGAVTGKVGMGTAAELINASASPAAASATAKAPPGGYYDEEGKLRRSSSASTAATSEPPAGTYYDENGILRRRDAKENAQPEAPEQPPGAWGAGGAGDMDTPISTLGFNPDAGGWGSAGTTPGFDPDAGGWNTNQGEDPELGEPPPPGPPGKGGGRIPESAAGLVADPVREALDGVVEQSDGLTPPPDKLIPRAVNEVAEADEVTEEGERDFDAEWRNQMGDLLAQHQEQYDDINELSYQEEARMGRQAASQAARLGYSAGGGGYGAAMAQAAMSGQEMRTRALLDHQQKGLDMRMGFLDKMFQRAQQEDDQEMQKWVQEQQNQTLRETTMIDAALSATPETLEQFEASGGLSGLTGGEPTGDGALGGNDRRTTPLRSSTGEDKPPNPEWKYNFSEDYTYEQQDRMNSFAAEHGMTAEDAQSLETATQKMLEENQDDNIYDWWDEHEWTSEKQKMAVLKYVSRATEQWLEQNPDKRLEISEVLSQIHDKAEGTTWGDIPDWFNLR